MTDLEFDVLDELYFVTPYKDLVNSIDLSEKEVLKTLKQLIEKRWVKCFINESEELLPDEVDLENNYSNYHYLATKAGLIAHNSI